MYVTVKFTPNSGGSAFELKNVLSLSWDASRQPGPGGRVGSTAHNIGVVRISRRKSLEQEGLAKLESETIKLAAATETKANFSGEITIARAQNSANPVQTIRWEDGHVSNIGTSVHMDSEGNRGEMVEDLEITVTSLSVDDSKFLRSATA